MNFEKSTLPLGLIVNHERWCNEPFKNDHTTFELFWTSPKNESYYKRDYLTYLYEIDIYMTGILLISSPSDLEDEIGSVPDYNIEGSDAFRNLWYGILEKDLLGYNVDFINLYEKEIIFSKKNLKHLKPFIHHLIDPTQCQHYPPYK